MNQFDNYSKDELISIYSICKDLYYGKIESHPDQEPISDVEFDTLESYLEETYDFDKYVGAEEDYGRHVKATHGFPMLSLSKVHAEDLLTTENELAVITHLSGVSTFQRLYQMSWKGDGFGVSCQYDNGQLEKIVTRGNKLEGADITAKFRQIVPQIISPMGSVEIRCEFMMTAKVFEEQYKPLGFKHPRNAVVGIKNNTDIDDIRVKDILVLAVDAINPISKVVYDLTWIRDNTEFQPIGYTLCSGDELAGQYLHYLNERPTVEYPVDGLVVSARPNETYKRLHNGQRPADMIAIKFPAPAFRTIVTKVEGNQKRTGNIIPKVHFEPVEVDGRQIKQTAGFNYKFIVDNCINVGAEIEISIQGDIIPYLRSVITPSTEKLELPGTGWSGVNRIDENADLAWPKFSHAMGYLGFEDAGTAIYWELFQVIEKTKEPVFTDIFDCRIINLETIKHIGPTKSAKIINQIRSVASIKISYLIVMMAITGCGWSTSQEIAKYVSGVPYDFKGKQKSVIESFRPNAVNNVRLAQIQTAICSYGIELEFEEEVVEVEIENKVTFMLTGSPKSAGYKTKAEFRKVVPANWVEVNKIKEASILITDNLSSTSNKMKYASSNGISIKLYSDINSEA